MATSQDTSASAQKLPYQAGELVHEMMMGFWALKAQIKLMKDYSQINMASPDEDCLEMFDGVLAVMLPYVEDLHEKVANFESAYKFEEKPQQEGQDDD